MRSAVFVGLLVVAGACSQGPAPPAAHSAGVVRRVGGAEAKQLVASGALLLDVRSPEEYAGGHLDGARNIPVGEIGAATATLPRDKPIVVYCAVGGRASMAAATLAAAGFTVHNLGAMASWDR